MAHSVSAATNLLYSNLNVHLQKGEQRAKKLHADDDSAFEDYRSVFPPSLSAPNREQRHMRRMVSDLMNGISLASSPYADGISCQMRVPPPKVQYRNIGAQQVRTRPSLFVYVTHGTSVIVVNFVTTHNSKLLNNGGHKSVPCGNLDCTGGVSGDWETSPLAWQHKTQAPSSFTDSHGATHPVDSMRSRCHTCKYSFLHTNPVTLRRLSTCADR